MRIRINTENRCELPEINLDKKIDKKRRKIRMMKIPRNLRFSSSKTQGNSFNLSKKIDTSKIFQKESKKKSSLNKKKK
jgi:hypothetical protein